VNPDDGSDAYFDLKKGLHSVKTVAVNKLSLFFHRDNIPSTTKKVILVRWGMRISPHDKN